MTSHVYRIFDADETLLYVGCSDNVRSRLKDHRCKPWGADIATVRVETFDTRAEALAAEGTAIRGGSPTQHRRA